MIRARSLLATHKVINMTVEAIEFDRDRANQYDLDIRKAIPGYEEELLNC